MNSRFDENVLNTNGLACPYAKSSPERYKESEHCRPPTREKAKSKSTRRRLAEGWSTIGHAIEHVKRHHTPTYNCVYCGHRWTGERNGKSIQLYHDEHVKDCKPAHGGVARVPDVNEPEIMSEEQEKRFRVLKGIKPTIRKLEVLYEILGKPLPEAYHVLPLKSTFSHPPHTDSNGSSLFSGFALGQHATDESACVRVVPSGANARVDIDSGYCGSSGTQELNASAVDGSSQAYGLWAPDPMNGLLYTGGADQVQSAGLECPDLDECFDDMVNFEG